MTISSTADCPRCDAPVGAADHYCTACGYALEAHALEGDAPLPAPSPARQAPAIVACPACAAVNAASRLECARCHADLGTGDYFGAGAEAAPPSLPESSISPSAGEFEGDETVSKSLLAVTVLAALAVAAVILMLLAARGLGVGSRALSETPAPGDPVLLEIVEVAASSALPASGTASYGPENLIDGDAQTAWNEGVEGDGAGEWVELSLSEPYLITRLLLWNGHQKGQLFFDNARIKTLRIDAGERTLIVELLDRRGPQAVDLREPVEAERIRLTIEEVYPGERYADAALSGVQLFGLAVERAGAEESEAQPGA